MISTPEADSPSDADLMQRLARGEVEPLAVVYRRYGPLVGFVLARRAPWLSAEDIQDLGQEVLLTLLETAPRCRQPEKLRSWLYGIAVRKASDLRRKRGWRAGLLGRFRPPGSLDEPDLRGRIEAKDLVVRALQLLPEPQREVILLQVVHQLDDGEIAEVLGISPKTVWTRLYRARQRLLEALGSDDLAGLKGNKS